MSMLLVGWSRECLFLSQELGLDVTGICEPNLDINIDIPGMKRFFSDKEAIQCRSFKSIFPCIDIPRARMRAQKFYEDQGFLIANLVGGVIYPNAEFGDGLLVQNQAVVSADCLLGKGVRLNIGAIVMHDNVIGDFVTLAPRALCLGRVRIGDCTYVGANATIMPDVNVGKECIIGAGAVVTRDIPDRSIVKGVPAR